MVRLLRGVGADYWPRVPLLDAELAIGLSRSGWKGARGKDSVFATTREEVALDYAGADGTVYEVVPLEGSTVGWAKGKSDMVLDFEDWLRRARDVGSGVRNVAGFIKDVGGDIGIVETYLALGRQRKKISALVDAFLGGMTVSEVTCGSDGFDVSLLDGHSGEVWVCGPCELRQVPFDRGMKP